MPLVLLREGVVEPVDGDYLAVVEEEVLEVLDLALLERPPEVQPHVPLLLDLLVLGVVLGLAEALHEGREALPSPVGLGQEAPQLPVQAPGRPQSVEGRTRPVVVQVVGAVDEPPGGLQLRVLDLPVQKQPAARVAAHAVVPEGALVLLVQEGEALVVPQHVGQVRLDLPVPALVGDVEGGHRLVRLEGLVLGVVEGVVGGVVPEPAVLVAVVPRPRRVPDGLLPGCQVEGVGPDVEVHAPLPRAASAALLALGPDRPPVRVKAFVEVEARPHDPPVVELVLDEDLELDIAVVAEIHEGDLEKVPVVEGEEVGVDLLVEVEPPQRGADALLGPVQPVLPQRAYVGVPDLGQPGRVAVAGGADLGLEAGDVFFNHENRQEEEEGD